MVEVKKSQATKTGVALAKGIRDDYEKSGSDYNAVELFVCWAYAHGHNIPVTADEALAHRAQGYVAKPASDSLAARDGHDQVGQVTPAVSSAGTFNEKS